ncbi:MAG: hypothetical protein IPH04_08580 [Saprospirales bacterium]|nr:hypothetical protein [Saprospirales bacterium]
MHRAWRKLNGTINTAKYDEISPGACRDGHTLHFTRIGSPDFDKNMILDGSERLRIRPGEYPKILQEVYFQLSGKFLPDPSRSDFNQDIWIAESENQFFDQIYHPPYPLNNAFPNSICAATSQPNPIYRHATSFRRKGACARAFPLSGSASTAPGLPRAHANQELLHRGARGQPGSEQQ